MPRTRSLAWSELKIGILATAALVLAGVLIFLVGGQGGFFWQQYSLVTRFPEVQGLKAGGVVRLAGVEVGTVQEVRFAGAEVEVVMGIDEAVQNTITDESRASIGSVSLLGEAAIDVTASTTGTPLADGAFLTSVPPPPLIGDVAAQASEGLVELSELLRAIRRGEGTIGRLITDPELFNELTAFVRSIEGVVASVNQGEGTLGRLVKDPSAYQALQSSFDNLRTVTQQLAAGEGSLGRLIHDQAFAESLTTMTENFGQVAERVNEGTGTAGKLVNDPVLYDRLASLSERLDVVLANLEAGQGTMGQLLQDRTLYENMNGAVDELRGLIGDVRSDPRRYLNIRVSIF